jgi:maleylacetate reductase
LSESQERRLTSTPDPTRFAYDRRGLRVVFGAGAFASVGDELTRASLKRALIISTPGRSDDVARIAAALGDRATGVFDGARMHVPAPVVAAALSEVARLRPDCCVTLGGGSSVGLGKALALESGLPLLSIPTTYAGSEMTSTWGITDGGTKRTGRDPRVAPRIVIYDPALTLSLPPGVSAASGMNAAAHAVEALYAVDANPIASMLAEAALRGLARSLRAIVRHPGDIVARTDALRSAHFAGVALDQTSMGLHHKLCHVLGGSFGLPHALTHAVVLPHVVSYNSAAVPDVMHAIANAIGADDAAQGLHALNRDLGLTSSLRDLGLTSDDLDRAADLAMVGTYPNPRSITRDEIRAILQAATAV